MRAIIDDRYLPKDRREFARIKREFGEAGGGKFFCVSVQDGVGYLMCVASSILPYRSFRVIATYVHFRKMNRPAFRGDLFPLR